MEWCEHEYLLDIKNNAGMHMGMPLEYFDVDMNPSPCWKIVLDCK